MYLSPCLAFLLLCVKIIRKGDIGEYLWMNIHIHMMAIRIHIHMMV